MDNSNKLNNNICIIIFPPPIQCPPLINLIKLLSPQVDTVYVISSGQSIRGARLPKNLQVMIVDHKPGSNLFMKVVNFLRTQLKILCNGLRLQKRVDSFFFFIGGEALIIPILLLKILRKKIIVMLGGVGTTSLRIKKIPFSSFIHMVFKIILSLADRLIIYSHKIIRDAKLGRWYNKIAIAHEHFVDFSSFTLSKEVAERSSLVGYVGRLSEEKGVLNLIRAIPFVLGWKGDVNFIVVGDGYLIYEIKKKVTEIENIKDHIRLTGWINHQDMPECLNQLKLLVLPSFTEGLPNVILEAMACGTPVLATPVGAIPDVIKEGKTGFLLKSNDPKHIAERIIELLNKPDLLEKVSINAYNYVRENFSYEKTLEDWQKILSELNNK